MRAEPQYKREDNAHQSTLGNVWVSPTILHSMKGSQKTGVFQMLTVVFLDACVWVREFGRPLGSRKYTTESKSYKEKIEEVLDRVLTFR